MRTKRKVLVIILAAGKGTRMKSDLPKVLHPVAGRPMIQYLVETAEKLGPERIVTVISPGMEVVAQAVAPYTTVTQYQQLGTGHAVTIIRDMLNGFDGDILVLYGDTPFVSQPILEDMLAITRDDPHVVVVALGFRSQNPGEYGRLITTKDGSLVAIIEYRDVTTHQCAIDLYNSGTMLVRGTHLFSLLDGIDNKNINGEYYLTDIVACAQRQGLHCAYIEGEEESLCGINTRRDLARAEWLVQERLRNAMLEAGVTLVDPSAVHFCFDTKVGRDVVIHPYVVFGPGVIIGDRVEIGSFCHFEQASVATDARVGPYARLRPGTIIGAGVHVGSFVEVKKATIESGAKVNHLSYIGDGRVGTGANIGAGTIFCNYNGYEKSFTDVGADTFIGSNSSLIAPVKIGDGAVVGAGSVITEDVSDNALALTRGTQKEVENWAHLNRVHRRNRNSEQD